MPCGTPHGLSIHRPVSALSRTRCRLSARYSLMSCFAFPRIPLVFSNFSISISLSMVSNAPAMSSDATSTVFPSSISDAMMSIRCVSAVAVLCFALKPCWNAGRILFALMYSFSCSAIILSTSLEIAGSIATGL